MGVFMTRHKSATVGRTHSIYLRVPGLEGDLYSLITKKYEKERKQLAREDKSRVILLDVPGIQRDALELDFDLLSQTVGARLESHRGGQRSVVYLTHRNRR